MVWCGIMKVYGQTQFMGDYEIPKILYFLSPFPNSLLDFIAEEKENEDWK